MDDFNELLENTFTDLDLNLDMDKIYNLVDDKKIKEDYIAKKNLDNLRSENFKKYSNIDILKYKNLPDDLKKVSKDIINFYNCINVKNILNDDYDESMNNKTVLDNIYRCITRLDSMVSSYVKDLTLSNDENQSKFDRNYFKRLDIDKKLKNNLIDKYDDLIIQSSKLSQDPYEELHNQEKRKEYILEIFKLLENNEMVKSNFDLNSVLIKVNNSIKREIRRYEDIIRYLEDLIPENSKFTNEFNEFRELFNKIIAYDDTNLEVARQTYDILTDTNLIGRMNSFEQSFIDERLYLKNEEKAMHNNVGVKNLKNSLKYITDYYMDTLDKESLDLINYIESSLNNKNYSIDELKEKLKLVVKNIWSKRITDVYEYDMSKDYYFICSNIHYIGERHKTILITKDEISKANSYADYQIGFICKYNNNILYITENEGIGDDMCNLKTPIQLEQEFTDFKDCPRLVLDGYRTDIVAVYFIDDGNKNKYLKAIELANDYKLPLINLKK